MLYFLHKTPCATEAHVVEQFASATRGSECTACLVSIAPPNLLGIAEVYHTHLLFAHFSPPSQVQPRPDVCMWSSFTYEEPSVSSLLVLSSWLYLLNVFGYLAQRLLSAGLLGQILIGVIYGTPLAGWLDESWEAAFVAIGYVGLLVVVFEGECGRFVTSLRTIVANAVVIQLTRV